MFIDEPGGNYQDIERFLAKFDVSPAPFIKQEVQMHDLEGLNFDMWMSLATGTSLGMKVGRALRVWRGLVARREINCVKPEPLSTFSPIHFHANLDHHPMSKLSNRTRFNRVANDLLFQKGYKTLWGHPSDLDEGFTSRIITNLSGADAKSHITGTIDSWGVIVALTWGSSLALWSMNPDLSIDASLNTQLCFKILYGIFEMSSILSAIIGLVTTGVHCSALTLFSSVHDVNFRSYFFACAPVLHDIDKLVHLQFSLIILQVLMLGTMSIIIYKISVENDLPEYARIFDVCILAGALVISYIAYRSIRSCSIVINYTTVIASCSGVMRSTAVAKGTEKKQVTTILHNVCRTLGMDGSSTRDLLAELGVSATKNTPIEAKGRSSKVFHSLPHKFSGPKGSQSTKRE